VSCRPVRGGPQNMTERPPPPAWAPPALPVGPGLGVYTRTRSSSRSPSPFTIQHDTFIRPAAVAVAVKEEGHNPGKVAATQTKRAKAENIPAVDKESHECHSTGQSAQADICKTDKKSFKEKRNSGQVPIVAADVPHEASGPVEAENKIRKREYKPLGLQKPDDQVNDKPVRKKAEMEFSSSVRPSAETDEASEEQFVGLTAKERVVMSGVLAGRAGRATRAAGDASGNIPRHNNAAGQRSGADRRQARPGENIEASPAPPGLTPAPPAPPGLTPAPPAPAPPEHNPAPLATREAETRPAVEHKLTTVVEKNPQTVEDTPPIVEDTPPTFEDTPPKVEDTPPKVEGTPPVAVDNIPHIVENTPAPPTPTITKQSNMNGENEENVSKQITNDAKEIKDVARMKPDTKISFAPEDKNSDLDAEQGKKGNANMTTNP